MLADADRPKVSVIVPVFNVEQYLVQCLDSVVAQTLTDIEIKLVNDGSTDRSGDICHEYAARDPRIQVIDKENGGLASARNAGLAIADGVYIGFVDSDDWIEPCMYECMYAVAVHHDCDIVWTNVYRNEADEQPPHLTGGLYDRTDIEQQIFPRLLAVCDERKCKQGVLRWSNCLRIYRHRLIREHQICFDDRFRRCQDLPFTFECTIRAKRYYYLSNEHLYHNRLNIESLSRGYTHNMWGLIRPLVLNLADVVRGYDGFDFSTQMDFRVFLAAIDCVENEVKVGNMNSLRKRLQIIEDIMIDPYVRNVLPKLNTKTMKRRNKGYYLAFQMRSPLLAYWIALWRHRRTNNIGRQLLQQLPAKRSSL